LANGWWGNFATGSVQLPSVQVNIAPIVATTRKLRANWSVTGSTMVMGENRTGQLVSHDDSPDVWLVRESDGSEHTIVNTLNKERVVDEEQFWPWGSWQKLA